MSSLPFSQRLPQSKLVSTITIRAVGDTTLRSLICSLNDMPVVIGERLQSLLSVRFFTDVFERMHVVHAFNYVLLLHEPTTSETFTEHVDTLLSQCCGRPITYDPLLLLLQGSASRLSRPTVFPHVKDGLQLIIDSEDLDNGKRYTIDLVTLSEVPPGAHIVMRKRC